MRSQPLIAVTDVEASSLWYQRLLGCQSGHGGSHYEQLLFNGEIVPQLHSSKSNNTMAASEIVMTSRTETASCSGSKSRTSTERLSAGQIASMGVEGPNHWECRLPDPDGYTVVPASPYGTADGNWRP
jgi:hypothetical protein